MQAIGDGRRYREEGGDWSDSVFGSTPTVAIQNLGTRLRVGRTDTFRVEARSLNSDLHYALSVLADQETGLRRSSDSDDNQVAFGAGSSDCQMKIENTDVPDGRTRYDWTLTLVGCSEGTGDLTAVLLDRNGYDNRPSLYDSLERATESVEVYIDGPDTVLNLTLTPRDERLEVDWDAPSDNGGAPITRNELQYKRSSLTTWPPAIRLEDTETEKNLINLINGVPYDVRVRACNGPSRCGDWDTVTGVEPTNTPPTIDSGSSAPAYSENTNVQMTPVETYQASDIDGGTLTWGVTGTDSGRFNITGTVDNHGVLGFHDSPDYEAPQDANADNTYVLTVEVSDGKLKGTRSIRVLVTDVNEAPVVSDRIDDQAMRVEDTVDITIGTKFEDPDGDVLNYEQTNSNPAAATAEIDDNGQLTLTAVAEGSTTIRITAYDRPKETSGRQSAYQEFDVTVRRFDPPGQVQQPRVTSGYEELEVVWSEPDSGSAAITGYNIRRTAGSVFRIFRNLASSPHTLTGLQNGTTYTVEVQACSEAGCGDWSSPPSEGTPFNTAPTVEENGIGQHRREHYPRGGPVHRRGLRPSRTAELTGW